MIDWRLQIVQKLIDARRYVSYLEIGLSKGETYGRIRCAKKVGVDPTIKPRLRLVPQPGTLLEVPSDDFFAATTEKFDMVFIDGDHRLDQVRRDMKNSLTVLAENGTIVCHDVLVYWPGTCDVWQAWEEMESRPDLRTVVVDTGGVCGCGVIERVGTSGPSVEEILAPTRIWPRLPFLVERRGDQYNEIDKVTKEPLHAV